MSREDFSGDRVVEWSLTLPGLLPQTVILNIYLKITGISLIVLDTLYFGFSPSSLCSQHVPRLACESRQSGPTCQFAQTRLTQNPKVNLRIYSRTIEDFPPVLQDTANNLIILLVVNRYLHGEVLREFWRNIQCKCRSFASSGKILPYRSRADGLHSRTVFAFEKVRAIHHMHC